MKRGSKNNANVDCSIPVLKILQVSGRWEITLALCDVTEIRFSLNGHVLQAERVDKNKSFSGHLIEAQYASGFAERLKLNIRV